MWVWIVYVMQSNLQPKQPTLKLKTYPQQLLGFLSKAFELPGQAKAGQQNVTKIILIAFVNLIVPKDGA